MKKYMADPVKFTIYGGASLLLLVCGIAGLIYKAWLFAVIFLAAAIGFVGYTLEYGMTLELSKEGIRKRILPGAKGKTYPFSEIREVGVVGTNPFNPTPDKGDKTGVIYIYFSPKPLDETQRRALVYSMPRDMCFMRYTEQRLKAVQSCWDNQIIQYNTGSRIF